MSYRRTSNINDAYFTSNIAIGGPGGYPFMLGLTEGSPHSGTVVHSMQAWRDGTFFHGLEVELTDKTVKLFGLKRGQSTEKFFIAPGEKVKSLSVWASSLLGGLCGGFELTTTQGRTFKVLQSANLVGDAFNPEIGSGILVGVFGGSGHAIDRLGFGLLRRIQSAQLVNVNYPDLTTLQVKTAPKQIDTITYDNSKGTTEQEYTFEGKETVQTTESWSVTAGIEAGVETEVKAGFPILAEAKVKVSVKVSVSGTYAREDSQTKEQTFGFPIKVAAGDRMQATATLYEGNIDTPYTATMIYNLDSGESFQYNVKGNYHGVSVSQVVVKTESF